MTKDPVNECPVLSPLGGSHSCRGGDNASCGHRRWSVAPTSLGGIPPRVIRRRGHGGWAGTPLGQGADDVAERRAMSEYSRASEWGSAHHRASDGNYLRGSRIEPVDDPPLVAAGSKADSPVRAPNQPRPRSTDAPPPTSTDRTSASRRQESLSHSLDISERCNRAVLETSPDHWFRLLAELHAPSLIRRRWEPMRARNRRSGLADRETRGSAWIQFSGVRTDSGQLRNCDRLPHVRRRSVDRLHNRGRSLGRPLPDPLAPLSTEGLI